MRLRDILEINWEIRTRSAVSPKGISKGIPSFSQDSYRDIFLYRDIENANLRWGSRIWGPTLCPENYWWLISGTVQCCYFISEGLVHHVLLGELVSDDLLIQLLVVGGLLLRQLLGEFLVILPWLELVGGGEVGLYDGGEGVELSAGWASPHRGEEKVEGAIGGVTVTWH